MNNVIIISYTCRQETSTIGITERDIEIKSMKHNAAVARLTNSVNCNCCFSCDVILQLFRKYFSLSFASYHLQVIYIYLLLIISMSNYNLILIEFSLIICKYISSS